MDVIENYNNIYNIEFKTTVFSLKCIKLSLKLKFATLKKFNFNFFVSNLNHLIF
jgi:hypothetical protein